jgi:aspartyl aminopeptidase
MADSSSAGPRHLPVPLAVLAAEFSGPPEVIVDLDICLTDTQPAAIGGVNDEFNFAPHLDCLASCYTACHALIRTLYEQVIHKIDGGGGE